MNLKNIYVNFKNNQHRRQHIYITSSCKTIRNYKEHNKKLAKDEIFAENTNVQ